MRRICLHIASLAMFACPLPAMAHQQPAREAATNVMPEDPALRGIFEQWGLAEAIAYNGTVYISGIVAGLREGETDQAAAFDRAFNAVGTILARAGSSWDDVLEMTTYHTDVTTQMTDFIAVKQRYVRAPYPAWTAIDIDRLIPPGGLVEIRVIAAQRAKEN